MSNSICVQMVTTLDEMEMAYSIRRQVFIKDEGEPEQEQFDGNDFCAAHLLATIDKEPVGTMRLRLVTGQDGGFIIWERMAILQQYRNQNVWVFRKLMNSARRYTELMQITNVVGIVENPKLMNFWKRYGFSETGERPIDFRGHFYTPIFLPLDGDHNRNVPSLREAVLSTPHLFQEMSAAQSSIAA